MYLAGTAGQASSGAHMRLRVLTMAKRPAKQSAGLSVTRSSDGRTWALVHPLCVRECAEDLEEVRAMIAAGETAVAADELRWLLDVCRDVIEAHFLLGKLAAEADHDVELARGHFGYAFQLGIKALDRAGNPAPLSPLHPANRPFFDAGRGLAWCLAELQMSDKAREVVERLLACDGSDPLGLRGWLDELGTGGLPIVELG